MRTEWPFQLKDLPVDAICEAKGCYAQAIFRITLEVATNHAIQLFLCKDCKSKFCGNSYNFVEDER